MFGYNGIGIYSRHYNKFLGDQWWPYSGVCSNAFGKMMKTGIEYASLVLILIISYFPE